MIKKLEEDRALLEVSLYIQLRRLSFQCESGNPRKKKPGLTGVVALTTQPKPVGQKF